MVRVMTRSTCLITGREGGELTVAEAQTLLQMRTSRDGVTTRARACSHGHMALQHQAGVVLVVGEVQELLGQLASGGRQGLGAMKSIETPEDLEALPRLPHLVTQRVGPGIDLAHFRSPQALSDH